MKRNSSPVRPALTLVELTALAGMMPLVLGVAGATMSRVRGDCQQQLCAKRLGDLAAANGVYMAESGGWFPGSPMTTGQQLWPGGSSSYPPDAVDTPGDVVQIWDWAAPLAGQVLTEPLDPNRAVRWRTQLVEGPFACPSNSYTSAPFPGPAPHWIVQRMVSYDSMRAIMTRGGTAPPGSPTSVSRTYYHPQVGTNEQTPFTYQPRLEWIGAPALKVFLADGSRFTSSSGATTHQIDWEASAGGAFSDGGPTIPDTFLRSYFRSSVRPDLAARAYRHPCGAFLGLNVAFFDGHVDWMSEALSRHPDFWWPSDTVLPFPTELNAETRALVSNHLTNQRPSWWPTTTVPAHYRVK